MKAYFEPDAPQQPELLNKLTSLGKSAKVLIPYDFNTSLRFKEEVPIGDPWHSPETDLDIWGPEISRQTVIAFHRHAIAKSFSLLAWASLEQLAGKGWLRRSKTRNIAKCLQWRLMQRKQTATLDTLAARESGGSGLVLGRYDLIQFFQKHEGLDPVYEQYSDLLQQGKPVPEVFEIVASGRDVYMFDKPPLWANMTRIAFGSMISRHDFMTPEMSYVVPYGPERLADMLVHSPGSTNQRTVLLSFYGSINGDRHVHDDFLGYERKEAVKRLASVQAKMLKSKSKFAELFRLLEASPVRQLLVAPSVELPAFEGLQRYGSRIGNVGHRTARWDQLQDDQIVLVLAMAASSQFCFQPGGDTHLRHGLFDAWSMGCIPVIYPTAAEQCGTLFGGLLFRAGVRMEDAVMMIKRERMIHDVPVVYAELLQAVSNGRADEMRANIRKIADLIVMRRDDEVPDAFSLSLGVVRYRQQLSKSGSMPELPSMVETHIPLAQRPP